MFDLDNPSAILLPPKFCAGKPTLVTVVPERKKTDNNAKGTIHGCTECASAVKKAVAMPSGVSDLFLQARYTRPAVAAPLIQDCKVMVIFDAFDEWKW